MLLTLSGEQGGGGIEFEVLIEELLGQGEGSRDQGDGGGEQAAAAPQRRVVRIGGGGAQPR